MGSQSKCGLKYNPGTNTIKAWKDGGTDWQADRYEQGTRTSLLIQHFRKISGLALRSCNHTGSDPSDCSGRDQQGG